MTYSEFRNQFSSTEGFRRAYGKLTLEEASALIEAEKTSATAKACMLTAWREARRKVDLYTVSVRLHDDFGLTIVFYEDDSEFDGNDFEYSYYLDTDNAKAFISMIPHPWAEIKANIEEWLVENVQCHGFGSDLQQKWIRMGLHGSRVVFEDYPGGIYREETF